MNLKTTFSDMEIFLDKKKKKFKEKLKKRIKKKIFFNIK